jgi:hypothetical protein
MELQGLVNAQPRRFKAMGLALSFLGLNKTLWIRWQITRG